MAGQALSRPGKGASQQEKDNHVVKIALVGNCQVSALRRIFDRSVDIEVTAVADVNARGTPLYDENVKTIVDGQNFDFVLSQQMSDDFGEISSNNLRKLHGSKFKSFTKVYFSGLHPDLSYFGSLGHRFSSPLGDYHSKVALMCYAKGIDPDQCVRMFTQKTYEALNYFSMYENSSQELLARDADTDIRFASVFLEISKLQMLLYTINHPSAACMALLAKTLAEYLGANGSQFNHDIYPNSLVEFQVWPIYPEIGLAHDLKYTTEMYFYPATHNGQRPMDVAQFVRGSYEMYDAIGRDKFMNDALAQELRDIPI